MSQILNIFRKDTRRLWGEIVVSLLVLTAYAVLDVRNHIFPPIQLGRDFDLPSEFRRMEILTNIVTGLIPVSWWLLIARVVHAESLVGDRQFWITRPYKWKNLLAAKALFVAAYVVAPFVIIQCVLLTIAGFAPYRYGLGLAFNVVMAGGFVVIPLMALSAVTKNFARLTLTILGIAGIVAAVLAVVGFTGGFQGSGPSSPYADRYSIPLVWLVAGFVIVLQYARRRAWLARGILLTIPVGVCIAGFSLNSQTAIDSAYPLPARAMDAPLRLTFVPGAKDALKLYPGEKDDVTLQVRFEADGLISKQAAKTDNVRLVLDGVQGGHWDSGWRAVYNHELLAGPYTVTEPFTVKRAKYEELNKGLVTMRVMLAMTMMRGGSETMLLVPDHDFTTAELGVCRVTHDGEGNIVVKGCRTPMHGPDMVHVSATSPATGCAALGEAGHASAWVGALDNDFADFAFSPVFETNVSLVKDGTNYLASSTDSVCPGTMLSLRRYTAERRVREQLTVPGVQLPNLTENKLILTEP